MKTISRIEETINYSFKDKSLLIEALTHSSSGLSRDYERLEFLGDAVLGMIVADYLYARRNLNESGMSQIRAYAVNTQTLATLAKSLELDVAVVAQAGVTMRTSLMADVFEALVGAMFLDRGLAGTSAFVIELLAKELDTDAENTVDVKTQLQEFSQRELKLPTTYAEVNRGGPDHDPWFEVVAYVGAKVCGRGKGPSKKKASQLAAQDAFKHLKKVYR